MDFRKLKEELDKEERQSFYIFAGEEKEIMRKYIKRIDPDAKEVESFQMLRKRLQSTGLFNSGFQGTFYIYNDRSMFEIDPKELVRLIGPNILILIYDSVDKRVKFFEKTKMFTFEFPKLDSFTLARHAQTLVDVSEEVGTEIARLCNNEVARVELECDKLSRLNQEITLDLVYEMIEKYPEDVIFDMIKAVATKKTRLAYSYMEDLIERKESPVKIISLLYTQFRNILLVQSYPSLSNQQVADKIHLSSGQVYYIRELLGTFSQTELKDHLLRIQRAEIDIKTGKLDQHIALDKLLLEILG